VQLFNNRYIINWNVQGINGTESGSDFHETKQKIDHKNLPYCQQTARKLRCVCRRKNKLQNQRFCYTIRQSIWIKYINIFSLSDVVVSLVSGGSRSLGHHGRPLTPSLVHVFVRTPRTSLTCRLNLT